MSKKTDRFTKSLMHFSLSEDEITVYLCLVEKGVLSALQISRRVKMGRTKVYRLLDALRAKNLVTMRFNDSGFRFEASDPQNLETTIKEKKLELQTLEDTLPELVSHLRSKMGAEGDSPKIRYYSGKEGLQQVTYNSVRAQGELLTYEIGTLNNFLSYKQAEAIRSEILDNKITTRTLTNATKVRDWTEHEEMVKNYWQIRHIPKKDFHITHEILIYNNVYVMYRYTQQEIYCVEIYDEDFTNMQRAMFEMMWRNAKSFKVTSEKGAAAVNPK